MKKTMTIFTKTFKVIKDLGKEIYLVQKENKYNVIKKIQIDNIESSKEKIEEFEKKVIFLSKITNDNIIKYYDSKIENNYFNILMEYGGNSDLEKFIRDYKDRSEYINEEIIKNIIIQICDGLKDIHHAKIIHRDLTPDNIFINEDNKIKIGDFGIAVIMDKSNDYNYGTMGKFHYMAPEIIRGEKYNTKVDIYSLGCIIYELFTLKKYYIDKNKKFILNIDTDIYNSKWQKIIDLLLKTDPHERPDIEEVYDRIKEY